MIRRYSTAAVIAILCFSFSLTFGQNVSGIVIDSENQPQVGAVVTVKNTDVDALTNGTGKFSLELENNKDFILLIEGDSYVYETDEIQYTGEDIFLDSIKIDNTAVIANPNEIAVITIMGAADEDNNGVEFSSILSARNDPFSSAAAYNLSSGRFRARGYQNEEISTYLNGMPVNDLDDGRVFWGGWGGLNDVTRNRQGYFTLESLSFGFGGLGGGTNIDLRASTQRPGTRLVMNRTNRSYQNRVMLTHSSGEQSNGFSYSLSVGRRWGERGFIKGTHYDAYSYFMSLEQKIGLKHSLNLAVLGSPTRRGRASGSTPEMYEIADDNYYNPNWGYQNGEVRNAREYRTHQPYAILRHDWDVSDNLSITTSLGYQTGKFGSTGLDWYNAADPRPDYYRRLPLFQQTEQNAEAVRTYLENNEDARQIDWDRMYRVNRQRNITIENANDSGMPLTGALAAYIVEEMRFDTDKLSFNSYFASFIGSRIHLTGGINYLQEKTRNFKVLDDLLGADFYIDLDDFAERDFPDNNIAPQRDLQNINRILYEGDEFGWDYDVVTQRAGTWLQGQFTLRKFDFSISGELSNTSFYREGYYQSGLFPDNSLGKSETQSFTNYGVKLGTTYKLDGRNYFYGYATMRTRAPFSRFAILSPRTRNQFVPNLQNEEILGGEIGYIFRYPGIKGRISAYYTEFNNQLLNRTLYFDLENAFGNYVLQGIDKTHNGIEVGIEAKLSSTWTVELGASANAMQYKSRPTRSFTIDNNATVVSSDEPVYINNFFVPGVQNGASVGLEYRSPKFWFASLNVNYFDGIYLDFFPERRTDQTVQNILVPENEALFRQVVDQIEYPSQITVDFFGGKSWKIGDYFLFLNVSVNNLLDNREFVTGGFEQFRFDFQGLDVNRFEPRVFDAYGRNYSVGLTFSF